MEKGIDYIIDEHGKWVFTAKYHQQRGQRGLREDLSHVPSK